MNRTDFWKSEEVAVIKLKCDLSMNKCAAISSWSGGKDSCLAYYKAIKQGYEIKCLLNFISKESKRCCFHGTEANLIELQAERIGIPLRQKEVTADMREYEEEFKAAVSEINGIQAMVFGNIYLEEHKSWIERVCGDLGITPVEPLWHNSPYSLAKEFIDAGLKTVVVSCQADKFGKDFVGKLVNKDLLRELKSNDICPCGENGEFHTLVVDGPIFTKKIELLECAPVFRESFWKYWFLDIKKYR